MTEKTMDELELLRNYRWLARERAAVQGQLAEELPAGVREGLRRREEALSREEERFTALLDRAGRHGRTWLVLWEYYALCWTDNRIAEANGFSTRLANQIRIGWLREQGLLGGEGAGRRV